MTDHYFTTPPAELSAPARVAFSLAGRSLELTTDRGVFAREGLDPGTRILLENAPLPAGGTVLDLGCGYGPIACFIAAAVPGATVVAVDVNERAVALTAANAGELGLPNVTAATPEAVDGSLRFDVIYSNPPIRIGKVALHELLLGWLGRLTDGGAAYLVVHRNLGSDSLARWLVEQGWPVRRVTSVKGYRVLAVGSA